MNSSNSIQTVLINTRDVSSEFESQNVESKPIYGLTGLINLGNTCYMNSAIQAFSHNYLLTNYLFNNEEQIKKILLANAQKILISNKYFGLNVQTDIPSTALKNKIHDESYCATMLTPDDEKIILNYTITYQLIKLLKTMWSIHDRNIIPNSFHTLFAEARDRFFFGQQEHDAEEAYSCILQKMQEELSVHVKINFVPHRKSVVEFLDFKNDIVQALKTANLEEKRALIEKYNDKKIQMPDESLTIEAYREMRHYYSTSYSRVTEIFSGFLHSSTNCPETGCGYSSNKFDAFLHLALSIPNNWNQTELTIKDCLRDYCQDEMLDQNNLWRCGRCHQMVRAIKRLQIWKAPLILVISFKRFSADRKRKNTSMIKYPTENFNIAEFISGAQLDASKCTSYRLQCVINHTGDIMHGGHYFTHCLEEDTGKWHEFNDKDVNEIHHSRIVTRNAYLLFYVRQDMIKNN